MNNNGREQNNLFFWSDLIPKARLNRRNFIQKASLGAATGLVALGSLNPIEALASGSKSKSKMVNQYQGSDSQVVIDTITAKDFSNLLGGKVVGLSDKQLEQHFGLYKNYVNKTNMLNTEILKLDDKTLSESSSAYGALREMTLELSFSHNGVILHEMYFANLGKSSEPSESLKKLITRDFGSWDKFIQHFVAVGKSMRGWAIMGFDMLDGKLRNYGLDQHNEFMPAMFYPLLVLDVYEHAYMIDFGTARAKYLDVFMQNINWQSVDKRLMFAVHHLMSGPKITE